MMKFRFNRYTVYVAAGAGLLGAFKGISDRLDAVSVRFGDRAANDSPLAWIALAAALAGVYLLILGFARGRRIACWSGKRPAWLSKGQQADATATISSPSKGREE